MVDRQKIVSEALSKPPSGSNNSNYYYVNLDVLERMGISQFKPGVGDNFVRFINPKNPELFWHLRIFVHRDIGANNKTFLCLNRMFKKPCPICEKAKSLKEANPDIENDELKAYWPKQRDLIFLVDLREDEVNKGVQWWDAPLFKYDPENSVVSNFRGLSTDPQTGKVIDISDSNIRKEGDNRPLEGYDLYFKREGTGMSNTTYSGYRLLKQEVGDAKWYEQVPATYLEVLDMPTYEKMKTELEGLPQAPAETPANVEKTPTTMATEQPSIRRGYKTTTEPSGDKSTVDKIASIKEKVAAAKAAQEG